jgi:hypothetical protein
MGAVAGLSVRSVLLALKGARHAQIANVHPSAK